MVLVLASVQHLGANKVHVHSQLSYLVFHEQAPTLLRDRFGRTGRHRVVAHLSGTCTCSAKRAYRLLGPLPLLHCTYGHRLWEAAIDTREEQVEVGSTLAFNLFN